MYGALRAARSSLRPYHRKNNRFFSETEQKYVKKSGGQNWEI